MSGFAATGGRPGQSSRATGMAAPAPPSSIRRDRPGAPRSSISNKSITGPSRSSTAGTTRRNTSDDPVRAAQNEATRVWRADLCRLLERAEERFADVCWTTASSTDAQDNGNFDSELGHVTFTGTDSIGHGSSLGHSSTLVPSSLTSSSPSIPKPSATTDTLIWAHKAILYARAPNTFQTRFLHLRSPAAQLQHIGSTASLVSLPLHRSESQLSINSNFSSSTQTGVPPPAPSNTASNGNSVSSPPAFAPKQRKSIRGAAPPSSFSMAKPSLRRPISRSSISRPLRKPSVDEAGSFAGFTTSDSEGEGGPATSLTAFRLINARNTPTANGASLTSPSRVSQTSSSGHQSSNAPARKSSFASVTSVAESRITDNRSLISDASTLRAPISLGGVSQAFFEATLQYLYTGEEAMVDALEFLFEDRLASDSEVTLEEKLDKLRSDLTFMWRSKLYSDVKIVLGEDDDSDDMDRAALGGQRKGNSAKFVDIPDANMSLISLAQTIDTDRVDDSDAEDDELTSFSTHRMILASRSQYFASMLLSPYADSTAPVLHLPSPPFTPASFHFTLGFLYTGTLFFSNRTFDLPTAFSLWRAGAYLQIETLQALVTALIDREFCHGFTCSPPCRKCAKRVPRTLAFATYPDVSEQALQEPAIAAVSGPHFGMYWAKDVGNLDPMLQDQIVDAISTRLTQDPTLVVTVLRQLSIVGQRIDTERSSRWVESLRLMAETVENRLMPILHANLEKIVQSPAWSDLLDGVGSLDDVLEKSLVMLIDGLTEARVAQIYQILVGQVLLREQGFEVPQSRQAVENARASILRYLKKRWINVRALGGFDKLEKWCLKELADDLDVASADLVLTDEAPVKMGPLPSRLLAGRKTSAVAGVARPRSSLGAAASPGSSGRVRTASTASTGSASVAAARKVVRDEGECEAGPNNMRAAVLNRNAARTSVVNGHRSLSTTSTASTSSPIAARPRSTAGTAFPTPRVAGTASSSPRVSSINGASPRSGTPTATAAGKERLGTTSTASVASVPSARSLKGRQSAVASAQRPATVAANKGAGQEPKHQAFPSSNTAAISSSSAAVTPKKSTPRVPTPPDADKTPTKAVRTVRSAANLSPRTSDAKPPSSSLDSSTAKPKQPTLGAKSSFLRATPGPGGTFSLSSTHSGRELRARTLSSSSAGKKSADQGSQTTAGATAGRRSVTPTRRISGGNAQSTSSASKALAGPREAMPIDAIDNVRKASQSNNVPRSDSTKTIVYYSASTRGGDAAIYPDSNASMGGIRLIVGIPCIVSLPLPSASIVKKPSASSAQIRRPSATSSAPSRIAARASPAASTAPAGGGGRKVRATVRYLGPVAGTKGLWVGISLHLPPSVSDSLPSTKVLRLRNGSYDGAQYFAAIRGKEAEKGEKSEAEHRVERRRELWRALTPDLPFPEEGKGKNGKGEEEAEVKKGAEVQLFVRPEDVVWVVQ
ncbi:uncharacterized protein UDID_05037 [Ustilago sp. UG-2017a]|nr:uncharacterized protein UDID_05037 [Ustilago sp. UG-2017a]